MRSSSDIKPSTPLERPWRAHWKQWAETLNRYQLDGIASWLLDAGRPLAVLSAQVLYMGGPFLGEGAEELAGTLESDEETRAFASYLDRSNPS